MKLLDRIRKAKYRKAFEEHYLFLNDEEKEVLQLLLIAPRTSCQLRNKGFANPDSIIERMRHKGWSISVVAHSWDDEREFTFEGENPWN